MYPLDPSAPTFSYVQQPQLGPPTGMASNGFDTQSSVNPLDATLRRALSMQLPAMDGYADASSQVILFVSLIICLYMQFPFFCIVVASKKANQETELLLLPQLTNYWEDDLQSVVQMGFGQNHETAFQSQNCHGRCNLLRNRFLLKSQEFQVYRS